jgi:hypothetical protein
MDGELTDLEDEELNAHLAQCAACTKEFNLLRLPYRISQTASVIKPSEFFSSKVRMQIATEATSGAFWSAILRPAQRIVPALAGLTFLLLSIMGYLQLQTPNSELYSAYDHMFSTEQQPRQMATAGDITAESVLNAMAEWETMHRNIE